jgi:hypothetical protein
MYYSNKYNSIPLGIVDKKITGCGLSSYALENSDPLVLVVPTVAMIKNKVAQYPNSRRDEDILGVYAGVSIKDISDYLKEVDVPKIMVTYDSFSRVSDLVDSSFHIVIDEFSDLLDAYSYRNKAINSLLTSLTSFNKVSYISATPIDEEFLPTILKSQPYTELEWDNITPVLVEPHQTSRPLYAALCIIEKFRTGTIEVINEHKPEAAYFYVNSVTMIREILDKSEMLSSECRIICSNSPENKKKLGDYDISTSLDPEKMFNFITSCAFKGIDIYSDYGLAFVVSNNRNKHTLISIDTDIYQVAGRIRTESNPFRNIIFHIFNENPLLMTKEEFELSVETKMDTTNDWLSLYNKGTENEKKAAGKKFTDESYLAVDDSGTVYFDELLLLRERRVFKDVVEVYKSGLSVNNFYEESKRFELATKKSIKLNFMVTKDAKKIIKAYCEDEIDLESASRLCSLIKESREYLTKEDYKRLCYQPSKIRNELNNLKSEDIIVSEMQKKFSPGFHSSKDIKVLLSIMYKDLGINKKAKSTDIEKAFEVSPIKKRIKDKVILGYEL